MALDPRKTVERAATRMYKKRLRPVLKTALNAAFQIDTEHGGRMTKGLFRSFEWIWAMAYVPILRNRIPALDPNLSNVSTIPINKEIEGADGIALPEEVMDRLIEASKDRVIIDFCGCRMIYGCKQYPKELGCLFMGRSTRRISRDFCHEVSVQEAKAHVRRAIEAGLVPIVGEARADHDLLRIPYEGTLLTSCFCCECCCLSRFFRRGPLEIVDGIMHPVEGLSVQVTDDCVGCGVCASSCFISAIRVIAGRAVIDEYCRVCGRCAAACPQNAIKLTLRNPHAVDDVVSRILSKVDLS
jgi:ferredoxin